MVELIPKKEQKPIFGQVFFVIVSAVALAGVASSFLILHQLIIGNQAILKGLEKTLAEDTRPLEEELSKRLERYEKQTKIFRLVLDERKLLLPFFEILEKTSHPDVIFQGFDGDTETGVFVLLGEAQSFSVLEQQRLIWKERKEFTNILRDIRINGEGTISFEVEFVVSPELLDPV